MTGCTLCCGSSPELSFSQWMAYAQSVGIKHLLEAHFLDFRVLKLFPVCTEDRVLLCGAQFKHCCHCLILQSFQPAIYALHDQRIQTSFRSVLQPSLYQNQKAWLYKCQEQCTVEFQFLSHKSFLKCCIFSNVSVYTANINSILLLLALVKPALPGDVSRVDTVLWNSDCARCCHTTQEN